MTNNAARYDRAVGQWLAVNPSGRSAFEAARSEFTLNHAPDWVFDLMATGIPIAGGVSGEMEVPGLYRAADNVLMVAACIIARRNAIGKVPVRLTDGDGNVVESGKLYNLLEQPNQAMDWGTYARVLETYKTLYDLVAVGLVGKGDDLVEPGEPPTELVPLSPANLYPLMGTHKPTGTPMVASYRYADQFTGSVIMYEPHQILIYRGFNPHAPLAPLAPLTTLRRTMQGDIAARELNLATLQNGAVPAGVMQNKGMMTKEQAEEMLNWFEQRQKGYAKRGRVAALWGGLEYNAVGLTPVEMEYINGLKFLRTDYYMIFRVPPEMVYESMPVKMGTGNEAKSSAVLQWWQDEGLAGLDVLARLHRPVVNAYGSNGATARSAHGGHSNCFVRRMSRAESLSYRRWAARSENRMGGAPSGTDLWFDDNQIPCLVEHRLAKTTQAQTLANMGYEPDQVNEYLDLGLPPHPDNIPRVLSTVQPIEINAHPPQSKPEGAVPAKSGQANEIKPGAVPGGEAVDALTRLERVIGEQIAARSDNEKKLHAVIESMIPEAARKWSRFFIEQRGRVLARAKGMDHGAQRADRTAADMAEMDDMMKRIFPRSEEDPALVGRLSPLWTKTLVAGVKHFSEETGLDVSPTLSIGKDPRLEDAIKARTIQGLKVNDTTEEDLRGILSMGFEEGLSTAEIGDQIAGYYENNMVGEESARAQNAAATQTTGLVNDGRMIAARDVGGLDKFWVHGGNPKEPRKTHLDAAERYTRTARSGSMRNLL